MSDLYVSLKYVSFTLEPCIVRVLAVNIALIVESPENDTLPLH